MSLGSRTLFSSEVFQFRYLLRSHPLIPFFLFFLIAASLAVITAHTTEPTGTETWSVYAVKQAIFFTLGSIAYIFCIGLNYSRLRNWALMLYLFQLLLLVGLYFVPAVKEVHRWYRLPLLNLYFQPSDLAKITVVIALAWYLEKFQNRLHHALVSLGAIALGGIPALLILKEPDLGTAILFFPTMMSMLYVAGGNRTLLKIGFATLLILFLLVGAIFTQIIPFYQVEYYTSGWLRDYQIQRLNPNTYHQHQAVVAIALGQITGKGWGKSDFSMNGWLPEPYTDAVYPAFAETYGLVGIGFLLLTFYGLVYYCYAAACSANNLFGRLITIGLTTFIACHAVINIAMMSGLLPITGFPLVMISYGGSSVLSVMISLGIIQSIYSRRFMF